MADETIIIDVQFKANDVAKKLGQVNKEINELTDANRVLRNEIKNGNDVMGENSLKLAENESKLKSLNSEKRNYLGIVEEEIRDNKSYGTSINDLRDKLRSLTATYNALSAAERESDLGKNIQKEAAKTQEEISKLNQKIGNFRDNVGNYKSALTGFFEQIGGKWSKLVKLFTTNPIGLAISALVLLFNKLKSSFEKGDEAGKKLQSAFANLKPITDALGAVIDGIVTAIATFIEYASRLINYILPSWIKQNNNLNGSLKMTKDEIKETSENIKNLASGLEGYISNLSGGLIQEELETALNNFKVSGYEGARYRLDVLRNEIISDFDKVLKELKDKVDLAKKNYDVAFYSMEEEFKKENPISEWIERIGEKETWNTYYKAYRKYAFDMTTEERQLYNESLNLYNEYKEKKTKTLEEIDKLFRALLREDLNYNSSLYKLENDFIKNEADRQKKIAELRRMSTESDIYAFKKREEFLRQAIDLEKESLKDSLEIETLKYNNYKKSLNNYDDISQEELNQLNTLYSNMIKAQQNYNEGTIKLDKELNNFIKEHNDELNKIYKEKIEELKKNLNSIIEESHKIASSSIEAYIATLEDEKEKEIALLQNKHNDEILLLDKQIKERNDILAKAKQLGYKLSETELNDITKQIDYLNSIKINKETELQQQILEIKKKYAEQQLEDEYKLIEQKYAMEMELARKDLFKKAEIQVNITDEYKKYLEGLTEEEQLATFTSLENYRLALEMATQDVEVALEARTIAYAEFTEKTLDSFDRMFGSLSTLMSTFNDENEKNTGAQKALAVAQFAFSSGAAIAKGISEASAAGPFPYNLAAIATTVATILANLATARKFFNESNKYATGGIVPGNSYSGDNITARVNSGEMILTREQQKALFDMANNNLRSGNNFDIMVASFSEALKNQPAPVLNYEEFTNFSNDIANKNKLILK